MKLTYTIFDGNPHTSGPCSWPSHDNVPMLARSIDAAERRVRRLARVEGRGCGAYRPEDRLWYILWDDADVIVAEGVVSLGGPGGPKGYWAAAQD